MHAEAKIDSGINGHASGGDGNRTTVDFVGFFQHSGHTDMRNDPIWKKNIF